LDKGKTSLSTANISITEKRVCDLVAQLKSAFLVRQEILSCFARQGIQVEGWFKGELLYFLECQCQVQKRFGFEREKLIGSGRRKADLVLSWDDLNDGDFVWIELKHWLVGGQKGIDYNAYGYFNDPTNGIKPDVSKLLAIPTLHRYALILMTANPGTADWQKGVERFESKFAIKLRSLTDPEHYPSSFFIGLLAIDGETETNLH